MGPKKPKKSKAELEEERLAREEEERKAKIAEEKKIAEDNEKKRLEELRIRAENKEQREKEISVLMSELSFLEDDEKSKEMQLIAEEKLEAERIQWSRYKNPSDEPDAYIETDMNTFIALMKEDSGVNTIRQTIDVIISIERVVRALESLWSESLSKRNSDEQSRALSNIIALKAVILEKLDASTIAFLKISDKHLNDRTELNVEELGTSVGIGMWASFSEMRPIRKSIQFEKLGVQLDLPKQILQQETRFVYRLVKMPIIIQNLEPYSPLLTEDDLNAMKSKSKCIVGDLYMLDILIAPPAAFNLRAKKWMLRDNSSLSTSITRHPYPSSVKSLMIIKVPDNVVISDDLRIAIWDEQQQDWSEDGIADYQYNETNRQVQFYITTVGIFALVKPRVADMPYRKWTLSPIMERINLASIQDEQIVENISSFSSTFPESSYPLMYESQGRLVISTMKQDIVIDIVGSMCKLVRPDNKSFSDLVGQYMSPGYLLYRLQRRGINLLPTKYDVKILPDHKPKDIDIEEDVIHHISKGCSSLDFHSNSKWNEDIGSARIGILARESSIYTCPGETFDYECILAEKDEVSLSYNNTPELGVISGKGIKYTLVFGNEYGNRKLFSHVPRPNEECHVDLNKTMINRTTSEAMERMNRINQRYRKTVETLLLLIKPYSLC
eukprot:gene8222-11128_t